MKKVILAFMVFIGHCGYSQTNTFPSSGSVGIGTLAPSTRLDIFETGGSSGMLSALRIRNGNGSSYFGNNQILFSWNGATGYSHAIKSRHQSGSINNNAIDFYLWQPGDAVDAVGSNFAMTLNGGNVGIGTQYPITKLDLVNPTTESGIKATATLNGNSTFYLAAYTPTYGPVPSYANKTVLQTYENAIAFSAYGPSINNEIQFYTGGRTEPFKRMVLDVNGNLGIGTSTPNQKLTVNGTIYGKEVKVDLSVPGPDYVFEKEYALPSLESVKTYIDQNKHLPEVPSAKEMESNGINLSEMNMLLLKKVEELTLYVIVQQKEIEKLKALINGKK